MPKKPTDPAPSETPKPVAESAAPPAAPATGSKRVLIVEDERPLAHALELKMKHEGYEVKVALTGAEGLKEAVSNPYDIILLDLIMPELDGFGVLQGMQDKKISIPVLVLSNLGQDEDRARAASLGVKDYFVKANTPILDIVEKVKSLLKS